MDHAIDRSAPVLVTTVHHRLCRRLDHQAVAGTGRHRQCDGARPRECRTAASFERAAKGGWRRPAFSGPSCWNRAALPRRWRDAAWSFIPPRPLPRWWMTRKGQSIRRFWDAQRAGTGGTLNSSVRRVDADKFLRRHLYRCRRLRRRAGGRADRDVWNRTASLEYQPILVQDWQAEARKIAQQARFRLVAINPCLIMG